MAESGSIPTDLQKQISDYYARQKVINNTIKNRFIQSQKNAKNQSLCQPIITEEYSVSDSENDKLAVDESWNCNVLICLFFVFLFIAFIILLNHYLDSDKVIYCDSASSSDIVALDCQQCPSFAECSNGSAICMDFDYVLHPKRGCLPLLQYEKRRNGERLF